MTVLRAKSREKKLFINEMMQLMKDDNLEFFVNSQDEPTVHVPDDGFQQDWPADSARVRDWIVLNFYETSGGQQISTTTEALLLAHIREECRKGGRRLSEAEAAETDQDIVVQAMICLINKQEKFQGLTYLLLQRLIDFEKTGALTKSEDLPRFVNIFSRRLRRQIPALRGYGIDVIIEHREEGSFCKVSRLENFVVEPDDDRKESSGEPSGVNISHGKDLPLADDSDGKLRQDRSKAQKTDSPNSAAKIGGAQ